jgi:hypothetical protein
MQIDKKHEMADLTGCSCARTLQMACLDSLRSSDCEGGWKPSASNEVCLKPEAEELLLASYEVLQNCLTDMKNVKHEKSKC